MNIVATHENAGLRVNAKQRDQPHADADAHVVAKQVQQPDGADGRERHREHDNLRGALRHRIRHDAVEPDRASAIASAANPTNSDNVNRRSCVDRPTRSSIVRTCATGKPGSDHGPRSRYSSAIEARVLRPIHFAHPARADRRDHFIRSEPGPWADRHSGRVSVCRFARHGYVARKIAHNTMARECIRKTRGEKHEGIHPLARRHRECVLP
jgi:hypothetical protein